MESLDKEERDTMLAYWKEHAGKSGSSMENMMLDKNASKLDLLDRPEVLSMLPSFRNARVLEMASGIGRFTGVIAQSASSVVTVEFVPEFLEKNRELNAGHANVTYLCEDVLRLSLPPSSFDLVFSCWLQMYLSDDEVRALALRSLEWVCGGGHIFFRESCFRQSGDAARSFNPSHYRHPSFYTHLFSSITTTTTDEAGRVSHWGLELVSVRNLRTYVEVKGNKGQICWLFKKVPRSPTAPPTAPHCVPRPVCAASDDFSVCGHSSGSPLLFSGADVSRALQEDLLVGGQGRAVHVLEVGAGPGAVVAMADEGEEARKVWALENSAQAAEGVIERAMVCKHDKAFVVVEGRPGGGLLANKHYPTAMFDVVRLWQPLDSNPCDAGTQAWDDKTLGAMVSRVSAWLKPQGRLAITTFAPNGNDTALECGLLQRAMAKVLGAEPAVLDKTAIFIELCECALSAAQDVDGPEARQWAARLAQAKDGSIRFVLLLATVSTSGPEGAGQEAMNGGAGEGGSSGSPVASSDDSDADEAAQPPRA